MFEGGVQVSVRVSGRKREKEPNCCCLGGIISENHCMLGMCTCLQAICVRLCVCVCACVHWGWKQGGRRI